MSKVIKNRLWRLINSMTKSEKRNFKLYAKRGGSTESSKFIRLFDLTDRATEADDEQIMSRLGLEKGAYSNLKRHLYAQVLSSLRIIYNTKEVDIEIREQLDFTRILYGKGHYLDALRTLDHAKAMAVEHGQDVLHLEILEFQKLIEARHVTFSLQVENKLDLLLNESAKRCFSVLDTSELFSLNIQIHGYYIKYGHSRTPEQLASAKDFWLQIQTKRVDRETGANTFNQKVNRFQAVMWYNYIKLNFQAAFSSAMEAYSLFRLNQRMMYMDPDLYLRCLYYVTMFAYLNREEKSVVRYLDTMHRFLNDPKVQLNENSRMIGTTYMSLSKFHLYFLRGDGEAASLLGAELVEAYERGEFFTNDHRWGLFLYKYAAALFVLGNYSAALDHLNKVINMRASIFREDLLINARLLHVICNVELRNYSLVEYHLTSLSRLMRKSREASEGQRLAIVAIRRLLKLPVAEHQEVYKWLGEALVSLEGLPFEQKALIYLDLRIWLKAHV